MKNGTYRAFWLTVVGWFVGIDSGSAQPSARNLTLACDRSSSSAELSCGLPVLRATAEAWVASARKTGRGRFRVLVVGTGIGDVEQVVSVDYPNRFRAPIRRSVASYADSLVKAIDSIGAKLPAERGSAVVEAIFSATKGFEGGPGTMNLLVIASDLRQVSRPWNFERTDRMPSVEAFMEWVNEAGLGPPRTGQPTTAIVCGFHMRSPAKTAKITAASYNRIEQIWTEYLNSYFGRSSIAEDCASAEVVRRIREGLSGA